MTTQEELNRWEVRNIAKGENGEAKNTYMQYNGVKD